MHAKGGALDAEYALFTQNDLKLKATSIGQVREVGYETSAEAALARLEELGATAALAERVATILRGSLGEHYGRGPAVQKHVPSLLACQILSASEYDTATKQYRGAYLDLETLVEDLGLPRASTALQALSLAAFLVEVKPELVVILSTEELAQEKPSGYRSFQRVRFPDMDAFPDALLELQKKNRGPRPSARDRGPTRSELAAKIQSDAEMIDGAHAQEKLEALEAQIRTRPVRTTGPLAPPALWAMETALDEGRTEDLLGDIDALEQQSGRTPATTYLRARASLMTGAEDPRIIAERITALALSLSSFIELEVLAGECWVKAGEWRRALPFARDVISNPGADELLRARAAKVTQVAEEASRVDAPRKTSSREHAEALRSDLPPPPSAPPPAPERYPTPTTTVPASIPPRAPSGAPDASVPPAQSLTPSAQQAAVSAVRHDSPLTFGSSLDAAWDLTMPLPGPPAVPGQNPAMPPPARIEPFPLADDAGSKRRSISTAPPPPLEIPSLPLRPSAPVRGRSGPPPASPSRPPTLPPTPADVGARKRESASEALRRSSPDIRISSPPPDETAHDDERAEVDVSEMRPPSSTPFMRGASMPPFAGHDASQIVVPRGGPSPRLALRELAETLAYPAGNLSPHDVDDGSLPETAEEARVLFTRLTRELAVDYRETLGIAIHTDLDGLEAMQRYLIETLPTGAVRTPGEAREVRRHGAFLSEVLTRRLGAYWADISGSELGHWKMIVPPSTQVWPFGRIVRFIRMRHRERDLVSYFLELQNAQLSDAM